MKMFESINSVFQDYPDQNRSIRFSKLY